jgi:hypothetical protein
MAEILWYYAHDQQQMGPVSSAELKRLATAGLILPDDLVWREGMEEWAPAVRVKGLFPPREAAEPPSAEAGAPPAGPRPPTEPPLPASDVRLASPYPPTTSPPTETVAAGAPPVVPPSPLAPHDIPPLASLPQDHLGPGLRMVLILAQAVLWATCVMVVILGGLLFMLGTVKAKNPTDQAASAVISCTLFVGSYVLARAGEHVALLVEQFLSVRRK